MTVPNHTHTLVVGHPYTTAEQYTLDHDASSHVHEVADGKISPTKVRGVWHTHQLTVTTVATASTVEIIRV